jgi:hypothetical protein
MKAEGTGKTGELVCVSAVLSPNIVAFCEDFSGGKLQVTGCKSLGAGRINLQLSTCNLQRLVPNIILGCGVSRAMPWRLGVEIDRGRGVSLA